MLSDTNDVLNDHCVDYWLDCGTLLGATRDNQLISWDKDLDLGCWKKEDDYEVKCDLKNSFEALGYDVFITDHYLNIHYKEHLELNMDLNFYTTDGDKAMTPSSSLYPFLNDRWSKLTNHLIKSVYSKKSFLKKYSRFTRLLFRVVLWIHNTIFSIFPSSMKSKYLDALIRFRKKTSNHMEEVVPILYFKDIIYQEVLNGSYPVPKDSESYLQYRYGVNWRTPVRDWDTFTEDGTVK
jgi:phosphorylcholine metabolism protein LicD